MRNPKDNRRNRGPVRRDVRNNDIANALISESTLLPSPLEDSLMNYLIFYEPKGHFEWTKAVKRVIHNLTKAVAVLDNEMSTRFVGMDKDCFRFQNLDRYLEWHISGDYLYFEGCGGDEILHYNPYLLFEHTTKDGKRIAAKEYIDYYTDGASCAKRLCDTVEVLLNAEVELNSAASAVGNDLTIVRNYYFHPDYIKEDSLYQKDINYLDGWDMDSVWENWYPADYVIQRMLNATLKGYNCKKTKVLYDSQKFKYFNYLTSRTFTLFDIDGSLVYIPRKFEEIDLNAMSGLERSLLSLNGKLYKDNSVGPLVRPIHSASFSIAENTILPQCKC